MTQGDSLSVLRARLTGLMLADERSINRLIERAQGASGSERAAAVDSIEQRIEKAERRIAARLLSVPNPIAYDPDLPIAAWREELKHTIAANQVVIVAGETGSGKSTQLPKICLELGRGVRGLIGHTQPRRIAARSIAERIAEELKTVVGATVGYTVRFTDAVGEGTLVRVMTDGILLNELQRDRTLSRYDTIIIDEAHERSLNIDFLLGFLKQLLPRRADLKVIITSATIDTRRFAEHFEDAPIVEVSGRTYPVEIRYRPLTSQDGAAPRDQTDGIVDAVRELTAEGTGDVLVFCSGEREIRDATEALSEARLAHTEVLPLYGRLSAAEQHRVFAGHTGRRIVVATNVAETSLTVPGIRYVVDAGTARISRFSRRTKVQRLPIEAVSQASANQRAGRCGRLGPGVCIRLYSEEDFAARPDFTDPEILRTNLASVILQMAAIGLGSVESFPFIDAPDTRNIRDGIALLEELQAVAGDKVGSQAWLTETGRALSRIPLDPRLGRMLIAAREEDCLADMLVITSGLSIIDPRERPTGKEQQATESHRRFRDEGSDFASLLKLWDYVSSERRARTSNQFRRMCRAEFLNWRRLREWQDIHAQLRRLVGDLGWKFGKSSASADAIHRTVLAGLLSNVGVKEPTGFEYRGARGVRFAINPGSGLFKKAPSLVMAAELVETARTWARVVAPVQPEVVEDVGAHLISSSVSDPWWDADSGAAIAHETVSLLGMTLVRERVVMAARFDPAAARELFIRHALVLGEWHSNHAFTAANSVMVAEVMALEARGRRADLLVDEDAMVRFYSDRIPDDVVSVRHFDGWWRQHKEDQPDLLNMALDDLVAADAEDVDDEQFPPTWHYGDVALPLRYEFDPSSPSDGVTVTIPLELIERIDPAPFEWNVPGFRSDLIAALIKSLPKQMRKRFVPVPDTARSVAAAIDPNDGGLLDALRKELTRRGDAPVLPADFDLDQIPHHLRARFEVVDGHGAVVALGEDLGEVRASIRATVTGAVAEVSHPIERDRMTDWDIDELPHELNLVGSDHEVTVYPALIDEVDSVALRLLATRQEKVEATWDGLRRLLILRLPSPRRLLRDVLTSDIQLTLPASPYDGVNEWMDDCLTSAVDMLMLANGGLVSTRSGFDALLLAVRDGLAETLEVVGAGSTAILAELHRLDGLGEALAADRFAAAVDDVSDQVGQFIYPGFLTGVGADRLADLARYLEAANYRLERLPGNVERDLANMRSVRGLEAEFDRLVEDLPWSPPMIDLMWMLQELRVSLFAQSVGTAGPVSEKRVRRALDELARS